MSTYRKQHYVNQSYLNAWIDPDTPEDQEGYVWLFPKGGGEGRKKAPKNIFHETDLYTFRLSGGERDVRVEKSLSMIESMFAKLRDGPISRREPLSDEDRAALCVFVAAMVFRSQKQRDHHRSQFQRVLDIGDQLTRHMRAKQKGLTRAEYQQYVKAQVPPRLPRDDANTLDMEDIQRLRDTPLPFMIWPAIQTYSAQMYEMNLTFIESFNYLGFITSDAPAFIRRPGINELPLHQRPEGLQWKWAEVYMPLSPKLLAAFSWQRTDTWVKVKGPNQQEDLNQMIRWYAEKEIVVRCGQTRPHWFSERPFC